MCELEGSVTGFEFHSEWNEASFILRVLNRHTSRSDLQC